MPPSTALQILKLRFAARTPRQVAGERRTQKNLSILRTDARRLEALAAREQLSQARVLSMALDAFEVVHGPLRAQAPANDP